MKNTLTYLLITVIIGLIVWDIFFRKVTVPKPTISYQYITDTIWDSIPYVVREPYPVATPPSFVTIFVTDTMALKEYELRLVEQDIIISSLRDTIQIREAYLKQYPYNPKLLGIDLQKDTISIGLLNITGIPQEDKWPIDLARFDYRWIYQEGLGRVGTHPPPAQEKQPFANYLVGGGVDLLYLSPYVSGKIEKEWARIRLYGNIDVGLLSNNTSAIKLGVDYKLNGKIRTRND